MPELGEGLTTDLESGLVGVVGREQQPLLFSDLREQGWQKLSVPEARPSGLHPLLQVAGAD